MKVRVEELSPIERKLSIEVEPAVVASELDRAYRELGRHVKVAGFRPGKVPRRILEQRFKTQVEDDVIHRLVEKSYVEAVRDHKVPVVSNPQVTNRGFQPDAPFAFEARVEVRPKLDPKDYAGLALKRVSVKVEDAQVVDEIERIRQRQARLEPIEGRDVAERGDWALVDLDATLGGKPFPGSHAENMNVEVTPGELVRGDIEALAGTKVGDVKALDYTFPKDWNVAEVRGKTAHFMVRLKGLKRRVTPELNDELAKEVEGGNTLDELKTKIRTDLENAQKRKASQEEREQLVRELFAKNAFEVPKSMVEAAVDSMLRGAFGAMAQQGIDPRSLEMNLERLREELRPKALFEVQGTLLFDAVADKEGIEISDEELEKRLEGLAEAEGVTLSQLRKQFRTEEAKGRVKMRFREEKTVEFLKSKATYS